MDDLQVLAGVNGPTSDTGSGKGSKPWSEAEIQALVHFLHQHRSQSSGGNFKPSIWNALVVELNKTFHTSRTTPAVKSKYGILKHAVNALDVWNKKTGRGNVGPSSSVILAPGEKLFEEHVASISHKQQKTALQSLCGKTFAHYDKIKDIVGDAGAKGDIVHRGTHSVVSPPTLPNNDDEEDPQSLSNLLSNHPAAGHKPEPPKLSLQSMTDAQNSLSRYFQDSNLDHLVNIPPEIMQLLSQVTSQAGSSQAGSSQAGSSQSVIAHQY
ncbi:hypothetical protein BYT27DRAFT_7297520 [Phlegmacium glaucopus]|nr:hypothetical protein BYT27DRAFT_7297520 [Phlegmacium glaucopus]